MISITLESVDRVGVEDEWNFSNDTEFTMHSILILRNSLPLLQKRPLIMQKQRA